MIIVLSEDFVKVADTKDIPPSQDERSSSRW